MASEQPRVLFVTGEYPPMLGGVGRFTAELARALQAQGAQIAVLTDKQVPPSAEAEAVRVLAQTGGWGWRLLTDIPACAREIGAEWVHVQYQTAAYGMHPAINTLPYFLRRTACARPGPTTICAFPISSPRPAPACAAGSRACRCAPRMRS